jgi:hypothetical protein
MYTFRLFFEWSCKIEVYLILLSSFLDLFLGFFFGMLANDLSIEVFICIDKVILADLSWVGAHCNGQSEVF